MSLLRAISFVWCMCWHEPRCVSSCADVREMYCKTCDRWWSEK
jgi:hypothetical protein